jgi:hypothetical protein
VQPVKKIPAAKSKTRINGAKIGIFGGRRARSIDEYTSIILRRDLRISALELRYPNSSGVEIAQSSQMPDAKSDSLAVDFLAVGVILVLRFFRCSERCAARFPDRRLGSDKSEKLPTLADRRDQGMTGQGPLIKPGTRITAG